MRSESVSVKTFIPAAIFAVFVALLIAVFPKQSFHAALEGVAIWWDVLFPALFPFFVVSELMLGFGIVHFFGTLLDPMMRPLFRLPGPGGFVMAMGFASGYPVGARLTSRLWDAGLLSRRESERLIAFTTTADPIFLIGAVSIGFFHDASLALIFAVSHYGGAVLLGLLLRVRAGAEASAPQPPSGRPLLQQAFEAMHEARRKDGRDFGTLLLDGIRSGLRLIIVVGGLVVFFSVVIETLTQVRLIGALQWGVGMLMSLVSIPMPLASAVVNGVFEVTLGAKSSGMPFSGAELQSQVTVAAFVLSWAGLSVHAQVMSLVSHMPVRYPPLAYAKLVHGLLSGAIAFFAWDLLSPLRASAPAWLPTDGTPSGWAAMQAFSPIAALLFLSVLGSIPVIYALYLLLRRLLQMR